MIVGHAGAAPQSEDAYVLREHPEGWRIHQHGCATGPLSQPTAVATAVRLAREASGLFGACDLVIETARGREVRHFARRSRATHGG